MLHELLLALSGIPGSLFRENPQNKEIEVVREIEFIHPSEIEQLQLLCKLGSYYQLFVSFIQKYDVNLTSVQIFTNADIGDNDSRNGIYIRAFASGFKEILKPYQEILIRLENEVLKDSAMPLSYIFGALETYHILFPILAELIEIIESKKVHGCQILDLLHEHSLCGMPDVKDALERVLHVCHSVLFKQLSAWMLHGNLLDQYNEFFIAIGPQKQGEKAKEDEPALQPQAGVIIRGITGRDLEKLKAEDNADEVVKDEAVVANVAPEMLPRYITSRLVEKILFIGQSVKMFKDTGQEKKLFTAFEKVDILQGREREFLLSLQELEREPLFSVAKLEFQVDKIKTCVAEQLWKLVVEDGELLKQMRYIKEIYLLGRGELFQTFIDRAQSILKAPPSPVLSYDLNSSFERSLREILLESEDYRSFQMKLETIDPKDKNKQGDETSGWESIFVEYSAPWPLHLLFTRNIIKRYNVIFRFLFGVKRTQLDLQTLWALQMVRKRSKDDSRVIGAAKTWSLRRKMAFLIDNLQYYLQVDVLEAQFSELVHAIKETRDFESIQTAHDRFLTKLMAQCFITMKPVFNTLGEVLKISRMFSEVVTMNVDKWTEREQSRSEELGKAFEQHSLLLFKILSSVRSHQVSPHLAQLLLRIDFNKFFSMSRGFPAST
ncbi:gamma-tubulin complex component 4-like [Rhopilema esculentum]|uniref:gamma-tubulin complex component 4-like n=1 Tax=Rhopilema esculentum TaxID=499914 RepID=UPI0031CEFFA0